MVLVGSFPKLSETFIQRKLVALLDQDVNITLICRKYETNSTILPELQNSSKFNIVELNSFNLSGLLKTFTLIPNLFSLGTWKLLSFLRSNRKNFVREYFHLLPISLIKPDIIHAEFFSIACRYDYLRDFFKVPFVASNRGKEINTYQVSQSTLHNKLPKSINTFDSIHCVSNEIEKKITEIFPDVSKKTFVNRPAVNPKKYERAFNKPENENILLTVGRLEWKKGLDYLLEAYRLLVQKGINFQANIIGEGSLKNELLFSINDLGLEGHVNLLGAKKTEEVKNYLNSSTLYILSSVEEGISNSVLEAMAMGIPVVTTNAGGMQEVIQDGINGRIVQLRSPISLAKAIEDLLNDESLRSRIAINSIRTIKDEFTLERQAKVFIFEYNKLIQ